jgi:hemerythrin
MFAAQPPSSTPEATVNPFAWTDEFSLACPDIDREHQALFRIAADLHNAMINGSAQEELNGLFARLIAYTRFHFEKEEALMLTHGFPDTERHRREHGKLTATVCLLERYFQEGTAKIDAQTMRFLNRWLRHHVCDTDQDVARHIRESSMNRC